MQSIRTAAVVIVTFTAIAAHNRAYSIRALQRPAHGAVKVAEALGYAIAVAIALLFFTKASDQFSRAIFAEGTILAIVSAVSGRLLAGAHFRRKYAGTFVNRLIILDGVHLPASHGEVVVTARQLGIAPDDDDPMLLDRLARSIEGCDAVVVACAAHRRAKWSHALKSAAVDVEIVTPELDQFEAIGLRRFSRASDSARQCSAPQRPRSPVETRARPRDRAPGARRTFADPAAGRDRDHGGKRRSGAVSPATGRGRNNRLFDLLKFRSFDHASADPTGVRSASKGDERMTRVGKFLRRTSIDELPQLINVIAGDMSIVGPRPHALGSTAEDALFWKIDARYFHRHAVKPGMTGLAQIRGFRGATVRRHDLTNRLQSDLEYLCNWTIWRDLKIIVATFGVILHPNAF